MSCTTLVGQAVPNPKYLPGYRLWKEAHVESSYMKFERVFLTAFNVLARLFGSLAMTTDCNRSF